MVDKENRQKIEVFFTKTGAFRAKIRVTNAYSYEVTVGGECWKEGKGREYEDIILGKCKHLAELVQIRYNELIARDAVNVYELTVNKVRATNSFTI